MHIRDVRHLKLMLELLFISTKTFSFLSSELTSNAYKWPNIFSYTWNSFTTKKVFIGRTYFPALCFCLRSIQSCIHEVVVFLSQYLFLLLSFDKVSCCHFIYLFVYSFFSSTPHTSPRSINIRFAFSLFFWYSLMENTNKTCEYWIYIFTPTRALRIETTTERK